MDPQPLKLLVARFRLLGATINGGIVVKKVEGIETKDGQFARYDLSEEPPPSFEAMPLFFWDELSPDIRESFGPSVGSWGKDVVGKDVVVSEIWDDWNGQIVGGICIVDIVALAKHFNKFADKKFVRLDDLMLGPWYELIIVVAGRVAGPDNKINRAFQIVIDPLESSID